MHAADGYTLNAAVATAAVVVEDSAAATAAHAGAAFVASESADLAAVGCTHRGSTAGLRGSGGAAVIYT